MVKNETEGSDEKYGTQPDQCVPKCLSCCQIMSMTVANYSTAIVEVLNALSHQQILGSCSPDNMSTTRDPPMEVLITTAPG